MLTQYKALRERKAAYINTTYCKKSNSQNNIYNFHRKIERKKVITLAKEEGFVLFVKKTEQLDVHCKKYSSNECLGGLLLVLPEEYNL